MPIVTTIIPIFTIVVLGWLVHLKGFMLASFLGPANRLVYYLAIPAMIFRAVSKAPLGKQFNPAVLTITLCSALAAYLLAWGVTRLVRMPRQRRGTFIQSAAHGNLGYIGLAVAFYFLGDKGLARAGIIAGFLMIVQNVASVAALQAFSGSQASGHRWSTFLVKVLGNPVIASALVGIFLSAFHIKVPAPATEPIRTRALVQWAGALGGSADTACLSFDGPPGWASGCS